jgi:hypothetical protein
MNKSTIPLVIAIVIYLNACSSKWDQSQLPATVRDAFEKKYPGTTATWQKEGEQYEAEYKMDGKSFTAVYGSDGSLQETEMEISLSELPDSARNYLQSHFKPDEIKEIEKLTLPNGESSFEAEAAGQELVFDSMGRFVKQEKD